MKNLSISVVSHGHKEQILRLAKSLSELKLNEVTNLIVTANLNTEKFHKSEFSQFSNIIVTIIRNTRPKGFGSNHNYAFKTNSSDYFAVLGPDILLNEDPFNTLINLLKEENHALVTIPLKDENGLVTDSLRKNLTLTSLLKRNLLNIRNINIHSNDFIWTIGAFMIFDSKIYKKINGFNEKIFLYCEDFDICARLYLKGYSMGIGQDFNVTHIGNRQSHKSLKFFIWHLTSLLRVWSSKTFWKLYLLLAKKKFGKL